MPDGDGFVLKINRIPFEPHHLAAAQSVECRQHDRQLQRGSPRCLKEPVHLVAVIKRGGKPILPGPLHLVSRISVDQIRLDGVLERPVDDRVVVDDSIGGYTLELIGVEHLDVYRLQSAQRDAPLLKVRCDRLLDHARISGSRIWL